MKKFIFLYIIIIVFLSCREEIIEPDNFVGSINEPVQIKDRNAYTFLLNAKNFTMSLSVTTYFSSAKTRFNVTLIDYESGYLNVSVKDLSTNERFRYYLAEDVAYHTELLDGYIPSTININTENFSGKVKIEFRRTL